MKLQLLVILSSVFLISVKFAYCNNDEDNIYCEERATNFINEADRDLVTYLNLCIERSWDYGSNITSYNQLKKEEASVVHAQKKKVIYI